MNDRRGRFARPIVSIMMDILSGATPLIMDVRQTGSGPLQGAGYLVQVAADSSATHSRWGVVAEATAVVDEAFIQDQRQWLDSLAAQSAGTFDGWEAGAAPLT